MIRLVTRNRTTQKAIQQALSGMSLGGIVVETPKWLDRPRAAHYVISKAALNRQLERFAASMGATPVIIPEAIDSGWLSERMARLVNQYDTEVVLVGSDYMNPPRNGD